MQPPEATATGTNKQQPRYDWSHCHQSLNDHREEWNVTADANGLLRIRQQHFHTALRLYDKYMKLYAKNDRNVTTLRHRPPGGTEMECPGFHTNGAMLIKELGQYDVRTFDSHLQRLTEAGFCWRLRQHGDRQDGAPRKNRKPHTWNSIIALNPKFLKFMDG